MANNVPLDLPPPTQSGSCPLLWVDLIGESLKQGSPYVVVPVASIAGTGPLGSPALERMSIDRSQCPRGQMYLGRDSRSRHPAPRRVSVFLRPARSETHSRAHRQVSTGHAADGADSTWRALENGLHARVEDHRLRAQSTEQGERGPTAAGQVGRHFGAGSYPHSRVGPQSPGHAGIEVGATMFLWVLREDDERLL